MILPISPLTTSAADPTSVSVVLLASVVASTVTVSLAPFAVTEVAAEPVVIEMPLSAASPVVTVSAPVREPAAISPTRPVTVSAAEPASVSAVFSASAVALTVTTSLAPLAVIEVAAEPVVIAMPLSAALPVVTVSAPVSEPAAIFPTRPVTVSAADPASVSVVFCASAVAFTVTVSVAPSCAVIEVAAEPVVIADAVVGGIPRGHGQRAGQRTGRDVADQAGHCLCRRAGQRQRGVLGQRRGIDRHHVAGPARGDRGRRRTGRNR